MCHFSTGSVSSASLPAFIRQQARVRSDRLPTPLPPEEDIGEPNADVVHLTSKLPDRVRAAADHGRFSKDAYRDVVDRQLLNAMNPGVEDLAEHLWARAHGPVGTSRGPVRRDD